MKIILLKNLPSLGRRGETKEVSAGYARNFLLPQKIAAPADPKQIQAVQQQLAATKTKKVFKLPAAELTKKIKGVVLQFLEKADDKGTFFAGITKEKLAGALAGQGIAVSAKQILLKAPIKQAGEYQIEVKLAANSKSQFKLITKEK